MGGNYILFKEYKEEDDEDTVTELEGERMRNIHARYEGYHSKESKDEANHDSEVLLAELGEGHQEDGGGVHCVP